MLDSRLLRVHRRANLTASLMVAVLVVSFITPPTHAAWWDDLWDGIRRTIRDIRPPEGRPNDRRAGNVVYWFG